MSDTFLPPLEAQTAITDETGRPTLYFQRFMQQLQAGANISVNNGVVDVSGVLTYIDGNGDGTVANPTGWVTGEWRIMPSKDFVVENANTHVFLEFDPFTYANGVMWGGDAAFAQVWGLGIPAASGRFQLLGSAGFEFADQPYVVNNKIFHEGNLSFGSGLTYNVGTGVLSTSGGGGGGGIEVPFVTPTTAGFTNLNFGAGTTFTNTAKGVLVKDTTGTTNIRGVFQVPDPTNWTCIMRLHRLALNGGSGYQAMPFVRNSTSGRIMLLGETGLTNYLLQAWTSVTALSGNAIANQAADIANFPWHKIQRIGNELDWYVSMDGENWGMVLIGTTTTGWAPSNFLNAAGGNIDGVGFGLLASGATATAPLGTTCCSFQLTTP